MARRSTAQPVLPFGELPEQARRVEESEVARLERALGWEQILRAAFAEPDRNSGFLELAEEAVRAQPGDGHILLLAATAALLDADPARAQVFLKRFSKRFVPVAPWHLLRALALGQENKLAAARAVLDDHGLADEFDVMWLFPGGLRRRRWLHGQYNRIFDRDKAGRRKRAPKAGRDVKAAVHAKAAPTAKPGAPGDKTVPIAAAAPPAAPAAPAPAPVPPLPPIDVDLPFAVELDLAPLIAAVQKPPDHDGGWYDLRERFACLDLAQGFDELLCLPHLNGIETFWYQVETVRKVLKQFRGRVLLADEVGLGKTIEAGMVLKEYLLRGMVDRVLVLTPAALVGQWREELEMKFGFAGATTQDALLREDADAFWNRNRIIASIATARRQEHAERVLRHNFDLVIIDEAHHLRDRSSQSWKLVDALNKRFLLLLSATPVQNDLVELYNLLTLLKPGIFKTQKEFRAAYMTPGHPRRPANPERLRELMRGAMIRNTRAVVALKLPRRHALTIKVDCTPEEATAYADLAMAARQFAGRRGAGRHGLALQNLLSAAGSSPNAAAGALLRFAARHPDDNPHRCQGGGAA